MVLPIGVGRSRSGVPDGVGGGSDDRVVLVVRFRFLTGGLFPRKARIDTAVSRLSVVVEGETLVSGRNTGRKENYKYCLKVPSQFSY